MRLLLVDDNVRFGHLLCDHLKAAGFATDLTGTMAEFEEAAALHTYALYLIDLELPDGDGLELIGQLRTRRRMIPILVVTARSAVLDRVIGLDRGADDYLVKPFNVVELLARVRALLRRHPALAPARIEAGRLSLDCTTGEIRVDGSRVALSPSERRLLALLIQRRGRVVAKDAIEHVLHGVHGANSPNAIEQLVSRLRRSLGQSSGIQLNTVRGMGYVLEERP